MADPLSAAGLAVGAASLAFELFSGCVKGYNLLLAASAMPTTCRYLLVRLQMEKEKLVGWAVLAGVSERDTTLKPSLKLHRHTIIDALREMQVLLLDVGQLEERFKLRLVADEAGANTRPTSQALPQPSLPDRLTKLEESAVRLFDRTRKFPGRLKWAAFRKDRFEELLSNIATLNDGMMRFLESHDRQMHFQMQEVTLMQILQVNNRIDDLLELVKSLKMAEVAATAGGERPDEYGVRAVRLARFKAVRLAIETDQTGDLSDDGAVARAAELDLGKLKPVPGAENVEYDQTPRSCGTFDGRAVWVEWKDYEPARIDDDDDTDADDLGREEQPPPAYVESRISKLAKLLRDQEKPPEFRVPECFGYVRDLHACRIGLVFALGAASPPSPPISLLDLLSSRRRPSLTTRIRIAYLVSSSLWYLHSTQWLHKGLRSENIVFESSEALAAPLPLLCGFDYSRPADVDETTEKPLQNLWHDLYRHPKTQFDSPREGRHGFRSLYDVYSLGVVLAEIGVWRPVQAILGIDASQRLKAARVKEVKDELLQPEFIDCLEADAGATFASVVRTCLSGDFARSATSGADGDPKLQLDFWEKVVKPLEGIQI